ncbi:MAG: aldo/keto reductase [Firmicutes bacterium]|nr:aldo/keto reductase [Bacillota bacterium]
MIYRKFQDLDISMLGFGLMRLPLNEDKTVNEELTAEMVDYAIKHGVNYFDTAWPYHSGTSEVVIGKILKKYPRDSFYLANKYPGHVVAETYDPKETFEKQLKKCQVDYFDFYLLHNVYENSLPTYEDPRWGIIDYFIEQRKLGRIKHLGFSSHGDLKVLKEILDKYGSELEFCQLQLNYLDWTVQKGKEKYDLVTSYGLPIIVMEPVRGGKLAKLYQGTMDELNKDRPDASAASYALRWFQPLENVFTVLSGMSDMEQTVDNVATFDHEDPLSEKEEQIIMNAAEAMKSEVPCTACRYCVDSCPMELDIPDLLFKYNQIRAESGFTIKMQLDAYPEDKQPSACIGCGACMEMCPQKIQIPDELKAFTEALEKIPSWVDICRERAEAEKKWKKQINKKGAVS